jgi:hypothetical protein
MKPPHRARCRVDPGRRITILEVTEFIDGLWVWCASVSFGKRSVIKWSEQRVRKTEQLLDEMVGDVGDRTVLLTGPGRFELTGVESLERFPHPDGEVAYADSEAVGKKFAQLAVAIATGAMYRWRTLTDDELAAVRKTLG